MVGVCRASQAFGYELIPSRLIKDTSWIVGLYGSEVGVGSGSASAAIVFIFAIFTVPVAVGAIPEVIPVRGTTEQFQQWFAADIAERPIGHINARRNIAVGL